MNILVVSDTHDNIDGLVNFIKEMGQIDYLFFLGDYVEDGIILRDILGIPTTIVRGNGDHGRYDFNEDELVEIGGKRILATHGHNYNPSLGLQNLYYRALELEADIVLYGHTHLPKIFKKESIILMNPGSPSYPRTYNGQGSIGLIILGDRQEEKIIEINI